MGPDELVDIQGAYAFRGRGFSGGEIAEDADDQAVPVVGRRGSTRSRFLLPDQADPPTPSCDNSRHESASGLAANSMCSNTYFSNMTTACSSRIRLTYPQTFHTRPAYRE